MSDASPGSGRSAMLVALFSVAIFLNAALLFVVQPMFTKMVLPLLGGSPAIWNTCLLFFQTALLAGYLYAHVTSRWLAPKVQAAVHVALLVIALVVLPLHIPRSWTSPPGTALPIPWLLGLLTVALGLPFVLLAAGAPMLQRWFSASTHRSARNPYFLYAASNLGSFAALLAYPFLIEPRLRLSQQTVTWLGLYCALVATIVACAAMVNTLRRKGGEVTLATAAAEPAPPSGSPSLDAHSYSTTSANGAIVAASAATVAVATDAESTVATPPPSGAARGALSGSVRRLVIEADDEEPLFERDPVAVREPTIVPNRHWRLRWVLLSFAPSSLLIGVTTYLSTDIASAPFLWVIPLALYLLTFVLVFARRPVANRKVMLHLQAALGVTLMVLICLGPGNQIIAQSGLHLATFFVMAMVCHRELADSRPSAEHLTEFYLWMSFGGVLGGVFNVLLAPLLYHSLVEYPFALIIAMGLRPTWSRSPARAKALLLDAALPALIVLGIWGAYQLPEPPSAWGDSGESFFLAGAALVAFTFFKRPLRLALGVGAMLAGVRLAAAGEQDILLERRSFFGVYRVRKILEYHVLQHGTTTHGGQSRQLSRRTEPLTYYYREGPLGNIFASIATTRPQRRVAMVGLGTGTIACYGRPDERWTYFEIDPLVLRIARMPSMFTYLRDCPPKVDIELGDARLSLAKAPDGEFDLIILDAFSSDAIPIHLMTREALAIYLRKLKDDGAVVFHISNRFLDLRPVLIALANEARIPGALGDNTVASEDRVKLYYGSRWIVLAKQPSTLAALVKMDGWSPLASEPASRVWTDDYSDILSVLRWR